MIKKIIVLLLSAVMVMVGVGFYVVTVTTSNSETVRVSINPGNNLTMLARRWQKQGWLPSALLLKAHARVMNKEHMLRVGEYDIPPRVSMPGLLHLLASAKPVSYRVSLIEGTRLEDALQVLSQASKLTQDIQPLTPNAVKEHLKLDTQPEGWLYPDTYVYHRGDKLSDIIRQAHQRMKRVLADTWKERAKDLPYDSPYDALIMASIVEKETGVAYERPQIAGVFVRRLRKNMRLETDPTVIYGLGSQFDGNLRYRHLRDRTNEHNTYRHKGLPPTPIALAGRAALEAALHPAKGDALYFVAKGDGSHQFSATLADHSKAVRKYQIRERADNYRSAPTK